MKILLSLALLFTSALGFSQNLEETLATAQTENKVVLLYFSGSDWCIPCMRFAENILASEDFKAFADSKIITYQVDFPRKDESSDEVQAYKRSIAEKYNSSGGFPRLIILDTDGSVLWDETGYKNKDAAYYINEFQSVLPE